MRLLAAALTGHLEAVGPAGESLLRAGQLRFGGHVSHPSLDKVTKNEPQPGGSNHGGRGAAGPRGSNVKM